MIRNLLILLAIVVAGSGCDLLRGPTPFNDAPVIRQIGDVSFVSLRDEIVAYDAYFDLVVDQIVDLPIEVIEPEEEKLTVAAGPIPRGWTYDAENRVLRAAPDHRQRDLIFRVYVAAEDAHDPPAYDVRTLYFSVQ